MLRRGYYRWLTKRYVAFAGDLTGPLQTDRRTLLYQYRAIIKCGHRYWDSESVKTSRGCTAGSVQLHWRQLELHAARYNKILGMQFKTFQLCGRIDGHVNRPMRTAESLCVLGQWTTFCSWPTQANESSWFMSYVLWVTAFGLITTRSYITIVVRCSSCYYGNRCCKRSSVILIRIEYVPLCACNFITCKLREVHLFLRATA